MHSPDGSLQVKVAPGPAGSITYAVQCAGTPVILPSALGLQFAGLDLSRRLEPQTAGYALFNLRTSYQLAKNTRISAGISNLLDKQYRIFTVPRKGPTGGACLRITPALFTTTAELDKFVEAINHLTT